MSDKLKQVQEEWTPRAYWKLPDELLSQDSDAKVVMDSQTRSTTVTFGSVGKSPISGIRFKRT
jgi:hypothetical protein